MFAREATTETVAQLLFYAPAFVFSISRVYVNQNQRFDVIVIIVFEVRFRVISTVSYDCINRIAPYDRFKREL